MFKKIDAFMMGMKLKAQRAVETFMEEEGDTNLISIIIVLGIVLALVVVFKGYIGQIISQIGTSVGSFTAGIS